MSKLRHRIDQLAGTAEKEEIALEERLNKAVLHGNAKIEGDLTNAVASLADARRKHTDSATNSVVSELSKVSPPILNMIVESHKGLLGRVESLELRLEEKQVKSQSELVKLLGSAARKLENIETRKFPVINLGGVDKGLKSASIELAGAVTMITESIAQQDLQIKALQNTMNRRRVFDFDFIREDYSDLLVKVIATERT